MKTPFLIFGYIFKLCNSSLYNFVDLKTIKFVDYEGLREPRTFIQCNKLSTKYDMYAQFLTQGCKCTPIFTQLSVFCIFTGVNTAVRRLSSDI